MFRPFSGEEREALMGLLDRHPCINEAAEIALHSGLFPGRNKPSLRAELKKLAIEKNCGIQKFETWRGEEIEALMELYSWFGDCKEAAKKFSAMNPHRTEDAAYMKLLRERKARATE